MGRCGTLTLVKQRAGNWWPRPPMSMWSPGLIEDERLRLAVGFSNAVAALISGVQSIPINVNCGIVVAVPIMPKAVINNSGSSFREFVLVFDSKPNACFGTAACSKIWRQYAQIKQKFENDNSFKTAVERSERPEVVDAWRALDTGKEFSPSTSFVLGLASIPPGTHTVEGDFSTLKGVKSSHRGSLSNYALEDQLQARQFFCVVPLADEIASAVSEIEEQNVCDNVVAEHTSTRRAGFIEDTLHHHAFATQVPQPIHEAKPAAHDRPERDVVIQGGRRASHMRCF